MTSRPPIIAQQEGHYSVMLPEIIAALAPKEGECFVDGTFGAGGYSRAILQQAPCKVFGIDRDPTALQRAAEFEETKAGHLVPLAGCFGDMQQLLENIGISSVDGIVLDLGVSSMQLDQAERGFSFQEDGPLDMRMDGPESTLRQPVSHVVNTYGEKELADILYKYGEEKKSRLIARAIVTDRVEKPFETTLQLAGLIRRLLKTKPNKDGKSIHPATRSFQALRIFVNDELGELERGLAAAEQLLAPGGRLAVVSFHSLEDRIVKNFLRERSGGTPQGSRHTPTVEPSALRKAPFDLPTKKAIPPSDDECRENPRSRSAKLRVAIRTDAPASDLPSTAGGRA
ncbi:16S rRNA (cytosine(1402)-N(4))-methyltransferase RsmH [Kiloniella laminariae]|uniref:16S rRNA (cytosine(1402)-N(4))-methyltransferase RsmH n=1 Tax=Kiloniella laminariae TaxID=454162 RepID=UPI00038207B2|nr:16S rRNA (cytosine(1402)-N(4))-methyltransferase RsmH [Kiloniella laminariae]